MLRAENAELIVGGTALKEVSISKKNDNANKLKSNSKVLKEDTGLLLQH